MLEVERVLTTVAEAAQAGLVVTVAAVTVVLAAQDVCR
jgi:hypothetical protein